MAKWTSLTAGYDEKLNFYEETLQPLVYSNPRLVKRPPRNQALVSHVDFLPRLPSVVGAPKRARANWQGVDYSDQILSRSPKPPQDHVVFTYDDFKNPDRLRGRTLAYPRFRTARTTWSASASSDTSWPATTPRIAPTSRISGRCTT